MGYYRGYILVRLKIVGKEWEVAKTLSGLESKEEGEDWKVTYATPVYGGWDVMVECSFSNLNELDKIVTYCRVDEKLSEYIEETTSLIGTKNDFNA
ncbi:MAG: hypothetical protein GF317_22150 [Candidatus Lokiarchaeota archaeon]|nr:hypothetical protein [Candidatus Lokiarchaeota archaeon]MBD3202163.1 hypothetical protein [Candidatus Lokiarchaeota archaeon]